MTQNVIFARIGYMSYYSGSQTGDEKPQGGGDYNQDEIGHEIYNFQNVKGKLYGYFQPYLRYEIDDVSISLERINKKATGDFLKNVLVIFFAKKPVKGGQFIVGWYRNATVYRRYQKDFFKKSRDKYWYNLVADTADSVLLPTSYRLYNIPRGLSNYRKKGQSKAGTPGRANIFYLSDELGNPRNFSDSKYSWINGALDYINDYQGDNLLEEPSLEEIHNSGFAKGQGFQIDKFERKAIEDYSMKRAEQYFTKKQYVVKDVSRIKSYDLLCTKGQEKLLVEVKGTKSDGSSVILTKNEVNVAKKGQSALYILHSIKIKHRGKSVKASNGEETVIKPWKLDIKKLKPLTYSYYL